MKYSEVHLKAGCHEEEGDLYLNENDKNTGWKK